MSSTTQMLQKTAVAYAKTGPAIYHSHHDMIRFWERAVRRAGLPVRLTQGFNPRPRIIFPHALGLGIASLREEVELELFRAVPVDELLDRVRAAAGDTLEITGAVNLPPVKKSRQMQTSSYLVRGWSDEGFSLLPGAVSAIVSLEEIVVERGAPDNRRRLDIRPFLGGLFCDPEERALRLDLIHTLTGSARPDEAARLAAERTGDDPCDLTILKTGMTLS